MIERVIGDSNFKALKLFEALLHKFLSYLSGLVDQATFS